MDGWLALFAELGLDVDADEWRAANPQLYPSPPPASPTLPSAPHHYDKDGTPIFTSEQIEWGMPEQFGHTTYLVAETARSAHPFALDYNDEVAVAINHKRAHIYDRYYRMRWTFEHMVGCHGNVTPLELDEIRGRIDPSVVQTRGVYEHIRKTIKRLRWPHLYISIPHIIRQLGGSSWTVRNEQAYSILRQAKTLHHYFNVQKGKLGRQRFPKLQYVLLRLMDLHEIVPPYKVPWARTSVKRRQLGALFAQLTAKC